MPNKFDSVDEKQLDAILAKMELDEKLGQMFQIDWRCMRPPSNSFKGILHAVTKRIIPRIATIEWLHDDSKPLDKTSVATTRTHMLGSVLGGGGAAPAPNVPEQWRAQNDELQNAARSTSSGVPLLIGNDSVHGQNNLQHAVLFPHHIGLGCARDGRGAPDAELVEALAAMATAESYACGINWMFSPCVTVPQDVRWGRTYEGFSEDPEVVATLGAAEVRGIQDSGFPMAACVKHWIADGGTKYGSGTSMFAWSGAPIHVLDQGDAVVDEAELRAVHMPPYLPSLNAGALTVMASYSSWNGLKVHASHYLLTTVLKEELGFAGFVVSDYNAVQQCASSYPEAVVKCINAGVDMVMTAGGLNADIGWERQLNALRTAVRKGDIALSRIDDAVRRILRVKAALGLLAGLPRPADAGAAPTSEGASATPSAAQLAEAYTSVGCAKHRALARRAVRQSLVLLQNGRGALPLDPASALHVGGRGAHDLGMQCGGWSMEWLGFKGNALTSGTTIWQAISAVCPHATLHTGADGARTQPRTVAPDSPPPTTLLVLGEPPYAEGAGDRRAVALSDADVSAIDAAANGTTKVVVVLLCGRPLAIPPQTLAKIDALLVAWLPGTEGAGVADALFGHGALSGKLSFSWPRTTSQPCRTQRADGTDGALFPLGFGLELAATR